MNICFLVKSQILLPLKRRSLTVLEMIIKFFMFFSLEKRREYISPVCRLLKRFSAIKGGINWRYCRVKRFLAKVQFCARKYMAAYEIHYTFQWKYEIKSSIHLLQYLLYS
jgi:hypothetical protein